MPQKIDSFLREGIGESVLRVNSMATAAVAVHAWVYILKYQTFHETLPHH
jgi:hypothetical protein